MMKRSLIIIAISFLVLSAHGQKFLTRNGYIGFYSHTPLEDVKADNNQVAGALDSKTGELVFQVLIKSFHFEKALMEEHFNENYMESEKFPKAVFKGKIINISAVDFTKNGVYNVETEGDLTIRDVTKKVSTKGTIEVLSDGLKGDSKFIIAPEDYNIKIPSVVRDNIAKTIEVTVSMKFSPVQNK